MRMIILAAGTGSRLRPLTDDRPKCLIPLAGRKLLDWQARAARLAGIGDVRIVGGHGIGLLRAHGLPTLENPDYTTTNMVRTLFCAEAAFGDAFVLSYGDIVYQPAVLSALLASTAPVSVVVDRCWRPYWEDRFDDPLSDAETLRLGPGGHILEIGKRPHSLDEIEAQYIGLVLFREQGVAELRRAYAQAEADESAGRAPFGGPRSVDRLYMTDLLQGMIDMDIPVAAVPVDGGWMEIDSHTDLDLAERRFAAEGWSRHWGDEPW